MVKVGLRALRKTQNVQEVKNPESLLVSIPPLSSFTYEPAVTPVSHQVNVVGTTQVVNFLAALPVAHVHEFEKTYSRCHYQNGIALETCPLQSAGAASILSTRQKSVRSNRSVRSCATVGRPYFLPVSVAPHPHSKAPGQQTT